MIARRSITFVDCVWLAHVATVRAIWPNLADRTRIKAARWGLAFTLRTFQPKR